jgi:hypothetical protein
MPRKPKTRSAPPPARELPAGADKLLTRDDVRSLLGISLRKLTQMRSAGQYPGPDVRIGTLARWTVAAHNAAVERLRTQSGG